jgi:broad specificity phosphatase PhoE
VAQDSSSYQLNSSRLEPGQSITTPAGSHNAAVAAKGGDEEEYKNWAWVDSRLTEVGHEQSRALRPVFERIPIEVVLVSPLSRAVQTALNGIPEGPKFVAKDVIRERIGTHPCDQRRSVSELKADFPTVDFSLLPSERDDVWTEVREPWEGVVARAESFLEELASRPEQSIAVVTHNDFLTALMFDSKLLADEHVRVKFGNAQHVPIVLTW